MLKTYAVTSKIGTKMSPFADHDYPNSIHYAIIRNILSLLQGKPLPVHVLNTSRLALLEYS